MIGPRAEERDFVSGVRAETDALGALLEPTPLQRNGYLSARWGGDIGPEREDRTPVRPNEARMRAAGIPWLDITTMPSPPASLSDP